MPRSPDLFTAPLVNLSLPLLSCRFHLLLFFRGDRMSQGEIGSPIHISLKVGANSAQAELTQSRMSRYDFCASRTPLLFTTPTYRPLEWLGVILFVAFYTKPWISSLQQLYFRRSNFKLGFLIKFPSPVVICHWVGASFECSKKIV